MFVVTVKFTIKAINQDRYQTLVLQQASDSLINEAECHVFEVSKQAQQNSDVTFFLYEVYERKKSFELHLESQHFLTFNEITADLVLAKSVEVFETC